MEHEKPKRTYIRRKKALNESIKLIQNTLSKISMLSSNKISEREILSNAASFANSIEAQCWSPRLQMTDDEYRQVIMNKTEQICTTLWMKFHAKPGMENQFRQGGGIMQGTAFQPPPQAPIQLSPHNGFMANNPPKQVYANINHSMPSFNQIPQSPSNFLMNVPSPSYGPQYTAPQKQNQDAPSYYAPIAHQEAFPPVIQDINNMPNQNQDEDDVVDMWSQRPIDSRENPGTFQYFK